MEITEIFHIGESFSLTRTFTEKDVFDFSLVSEDLNLIHISEEYAKDTIFKKKIVPGFLTGSLFSAIIGNKFPGIGTIYLYQNMKFIKPVFINDTITAKVEIIEIDTIKKLLLLKTTCTNQENVMVLEGTALVKPKVNDNTKKEKEEKEILVRKK